MSETLEQQVRRMNAEAVARRNTELRRYQDFIAVWKRFLSLTDEWGGLPITMYRPKYKLEWINDGRWQVIVWRVPKLYPTDGTKDIMFTITRLDSKGNNYSVTPSDDIEWLTAAIENDLNASLNDEHLQLSPIGD